MKIVANEHYTIFIDTRKNRLYLTLFGFWKSRSVVPTFKMDMRKAVRQLTRNYTILTDVTQMKTPPPDVAALHTEVQKMLMTEGLKKTAEVLGKDVIAKMAVERFSRKSGMNKEMFDDKRKAEKWLDEN